MLVLEYGRMVIIHSLGFTSPVIFFIGFRNGVQRVEEEKYSYLVLVDRRQAHDEDLASKDHS